MTRQPSCPSDQHHENSGRRWFLRTSPMPRRAHPGRLYVLVYVIHGEVAVDNPSRNVREGQAELLGSATSVQLTAQTTRIFWCAGVPLNEPSRAMVRLR